MRVLCIGDVVGKPGRRALAALLPALIEREGIDVVIANAENASGGLGLTRGTAREMLSELPVDALTGGNHIWRYRDVYELLDQEPRLFRPLNYPEPAPGRGLGMVHGAGGQAVGLVTLMGRTFMDPNPCPFEAADRAVEQLRAEARVIIVEIHGEATSEKRALGWHLDGRVSGLFGTHTHVATADEEVLPGGTGYITDIGMTGPYDSVIGMRKKDMIQRFRTLRPVPFNVASRDVRLCGAIFDIDDSTGKARAVTRVREPLTDRD